MIWSVHVVYAHMYADMSAYTEAKRVNQALLYYSSPYSLEESLAESGGGQQSAILLSLHHGGTGIIGRYSLIWLLCGRLGIRVQVLTFMQQTLLPTVPSPQPRFLATLTLHVSVTEGVRPLKMASSIVQVSEHILVFLITLPWFTSKLFYQPTVTWKFSIAKKGKSSKILTPKPLIV